MSRDESPQRAPEYLGGYVLHKCDHCGTRAFAKSSTYFLNVHGCRVVGCTTMICESCADTEWTRCCKCKTYGICHQCKLDGKHCDYPPVPVDTVTLNCAICHTSKTLDRTAACQGCISLDKWYCDECNEKPETHKGCHHVHYQPEICEKCLRRAKEPLRLCTACKSPLCRRHSYDFADRIYCL